MRDSRTQGKIPTEVFPAVFFAMFACRLPSFNELEQQRRATSWKRWLGGHPLPCADELAYVSERLDLDALRDCQGRIHSCLKRNKIIRARHGWILAAVDGHEINSSYKRCCDQCLERTIKVDGKPTVQYYHRIVALQIISEGFYFLFDLEALLPGEDEVEAALRLVSRVLKNHPRSFDVLAADAIYLRPSTIDLLTSHGKHLIAVLKENQPELLAEARTLLPKEAPQCFRTESSPGKPARNVELRQADGFTTESITTPLRIVHAHETGVRRERIANEWKKSPIDSHWYWATTMPTSLIQGRVIFEFGHDRWRIENEGFNELVTSWHSRHIFHHHSNSILALWLILFSTHAVFHCFHARNLKPALRHGHTVIYFARLLAATMRTECWWPPPPG